MGQPQALESADVLEQGTITFLYRPRVGTPDAEDLDDVQRLLILLVPIGSELERLIVVGRKRLPPSQKRDRFWGFVDLRLSSYDMNAALAAHVYRTATRGIRHLPAARAVADGTYELVTHGPHTHLRWWARTIDEHDPVARQLEIESAGDYIVTVANPDPTVWGLTAAPDLQGTLFDDIEMHVTVPTPFPPALQRRFRQRRYLPLDSAEWLNHPGAELVFVNAG